jgi:hypothetical protein
MTKRQRWFSLAGTAALALPIATVAALSAIAQPSASDVVVEVTGDVPGFASQEQLARFLAERMTVESPSWRFVTTTAGQSKPRNRAEFTFKIVKVVWPGGTARGVRLATVSRIYLKTEVRLYLQDHYQMTMSSESSADSPDILADMAANVTRSLIASAEAANR